MGETPYDGLYGEAPPERGIFFRLQVYERVGISLDEVYERASALIAALAASLAVLKEKRDKEKVEGLNLSEINIHRRNFTPLSINACKCRGGTGGERVDGKVG